MEKYAFKAKLKYKMDQTNALTKRINQYHEPTHNPSHEVQSKHRSNHSTNKPQKSHQYLKSQALTLAKDQASGEKHP